MADESKRNNVLRVILVVVACAVIAATLWLWVVNYRTLLEVARVNEQVAQNYARNLRYYVSEYKVTYARLGEVTKELDAANLEISGVRADLSEVQGINNQLKEGIAALERFKSAALAKGEALEAMIDAFKKKNRDIERDLQVVRKKLAAFQPAIDDLTEGRSKIFLFKDHIRQVKRNMAVIRRQASEIRAAAQKERDRLESIYGNGGYLIKDGEDKSVTAFDENQVEINVKIVN